MMAELVRILDKLLKEHFTHAEDRQEKRADEDYDEVRFLFMKKDLVLTFYVGCRWSRSNS